MSGEDGRMFPKGQEKKSTASVSTLCTNFINQLVPLCTRKQQPSAKPGPGLLALSKAGLKSVMEKCSGKKIKGTPPDQ